MKISIKFEAETLPELMGYITAYLASVSIRQEAGQQSLHKETPEGAVTSQDQPKKRGRPPKNKPLDAMHNELDEPEVSYVNGAQEEDMVEDGDVEIPSTANDGSLDAVALHKLKQETLARLRDLFMAGKGATIRELLKKHGHGALVFPEIDPKYFPAIKADIDRELG
jgi:hypothetical protein